MEFLPIVKRPLKGGAKSSKTFPKNLNLTPKGLSQQLPCRTSANQEYLFVWTSHHSQLAWYWIDWFVPWKHVNDTKQLVFGQPSKLKLLPGERPRHPELGTRQTCWHQTRPHFTKYTLTDFSIKYLNSRVRWICYKETGLQHEIALADKMSMRIYMITIEGENVISRARREWYYGK